MHWRDEVGRHAAGGSKPQFIGQFAICSLCLSRPGKQRGREWQGESTTVFVRALFQTLRKKMKYERFIVLICDCSLDSFDNLLTTAELCVT